MKIIETSLSNWTDIFKLDPFFLSTFIFRGQSNNKWPLTTSIERHKTSIFNFLDFTTEEKWMIDEFARKYHLYCDHKIEDKNWFEYLALMQHYGAPTRLLDFSHSIYIATYFAAIDCEDTCSIWGVNMYSLKRSFEIHSGIEYGQILKDELNNRLITFGNKFVGQYQFKDFVNLVLPVIPNYYSDRLSKQQGLFLFPTNSNISFMDNLLIALNIENKTFEQMDFNSFKNETSPKSNSKTVDFKLVTGIEERYPFLSNIGIVKFNILKSQISEIINMLNQMNITAEVLFPGLDGLAKSLIQKQLK